MLLTKACRIALVRTEHHAGKFEGACKSADVDGGSVSPGHRVLGNFLSWGPVGILHRAVE